MIYTTVRRNLNRLLKKQEEDLENASRMNGNCDNLNGNRRNDVNNNKTQTVRVEEPKEKCCIAEYLAGLSIEAMVGKLDVVDIKFPEEVLRRQNKNSLKRKLANISKADIVEKLADIREILGETRKSEPRPRTLKWADEVGYRLATVQTVRPRLVFADELMANNSVPKSILKKQQE